jgi:mannose-6-phosphate isomerase
MANSDNVLRGGLTPKHVDVPELLRVLRFDAPPVAPTPTRRVSAAELAYETGAREFCLSRIDLEPQQPLGLRLRGPELLLCVDGQVQVQPDSVQPAPAQAPLPAARTLAKGQACFLPASAGGVQLHGAARLFRVGVGS